MWRLLKFKNLLLMALLLGFSGCRDQIIHNLSENDANKIVTHLDQANISAEKVKQADGTWAISVSSSQSVEALKFLDDSRELHGINQALPEKPSLISSREDQRFRYERSISGELESTLGSLEGVLQARVHLNLPPVDPLFGQPLSKDIHGSASVLIIASERFSLAKEELADLVAGASGIEKDKISVLISSKANALKNTSHPAAGADFTPQVEASIIPSFGLNQYGKNSLAGLAISLLLCGIGALLWFFNLKRNEAPR